MGASSFKPLSVCSPPAIVSAVVSPLQTDVYRVEYTKKMKEEKKDLVIRCHVEQGRLQGIYASRDVKFPSQKRKIWSTELYCICKEFSCDHVYPSCLNLSGGACASCVQHDAGYRRCTHDIDKGGNAMEYVIKQDRIKLEQIINERKAQQHDSDSDDDDVVERVDEPPYTHQAYFEFAIRFAHSDKALLPGFYLITIVPAPEHVSPAVRKMRKLEGVDELHLTQYKLWAEERVAAAKPAAGNEQHDAEIAAEIQHRQATQQAHHNVVAQQLAVVDDSNFQQQLNSGIGADGGENLLKQTEAALGTSSSSADTAPTTTNNNNNQKQNKKKLDDDDDDDDDDLDSDDDEIMAALAKPSKAAPTINAEDEFEMLKKQAFQ